MPFRITYRTLLRVDILHHYFLDEGAIDFANLSQERQNTRLREYQFGDFLKLQASPETRRALRGARLRLVSTPTGFRLAGEIDSQGRPLTGLPNDPLFFGLFPNDNRLFNYSALRLGASFHTDPAKNNIQRTFYFSNPPLGGGDPADLVSLTAGVPNHVNGSDYFASDLVRSGGQLFEAIGDITNSTAPPNADWLAVNPDRAYASNSDEIRFRPTYFDYIFTAPGITAPIQVIDRNGDTVWEETVSSTVDQNRFQVDLSRLAPGRYTLRVNNGGGYSEEQIFFYAPHWNQANLWGVIAIEPTDLLGGSGEMLDRPFEIRIRNLRTHWRYLSANDQTEQTVVGNGQPLPLTAHGRIDTVSLNGNTLPAADAGQILPDTADALIYSNIYIDEALF